MRASLGSGNRLRNSEPAATFHLAFVLDRGRLSRTSRSKAAELPSPSFAISGGARVTKLESNITRKMLPLLVLSSSSLLRFFYYLKRRT